MKGTLKDYVAKRLSDSIVEIDTDSETLTDKWMITKDLLNPEKT